jgi:protein SCO1/2
MSKASSLAAGVLAAALSLGSGVAAHDGHKHAAKGQAKAAQPAAPPPSVDDLLFGRRIGGDFDLIDQNGAPRRLRDFAGRHVLLFFGYANCEAICSAAIPLMAQIVDRLGAGHPPVDLVMITVDPERDTPAGLREGLRKYDPRLIGLTGPKDKLEAAWKAFSIDVTEVARGWDDEAILGHGSYLYLLGPDGKVRTLLPPVLPPGEAARIVKGYLDRG